MKNNNVSREYCEWLKFKVGLKRFGNTVGGTYRDLFDILYDTSFVSVLELDNNRCKDGQGLRWEFAFEQGYRTHDQLEGACSVLEVILALAIKYASDIGEGDDIQVSSCFWRMIDNLGLLKFTDVALDSVEAHHEMTHILDCFMDRDYEYNGEGGLFPLMDPKEDQREVELWYQMSAYLMEKHSDMYM